MKQWSAAERGGEGTDSAGRVRCRDHTTYQRLRAFGFSKEFMVSHWYVPDRDRAPPHVAQRRKVCSSCGAELANDFKNFTKEVFGDRKLGRFTTGDMCRVCVTGAVQRSRSERVEAELRAKTAYEAHGDEMWERKP